MSAYAYYEGTQYDESVTAAKRYVTLHPGSPDAAYAQFLIGSSYFDQIPDITRDQERTERRCRRSTRWCANIRTPNMRRAPRRRSRSRATSSPARKWRSAATIRSKRDYIGAINRFKVVVTQYQTTRHVEEALMRLTETYMALGIVNEAQTAAAVLGHNFPDSPWYKDAYGLVQRRRARAARGPGLLDQPGVQAGRPGLVAPAERRRPYALDSACVTARSTGPAARGIDARVLDPCSPGSRSATSS